MGYTGGTFKKNAVFYVLQLCQMIVFIPTAGCIYLTPAYFFTSCMYFLRRARCIKGYAGVKHFKLMFHMNKIANV